MEDKNQSNQSSQTNQVSNQNSDEEPKKRNEMNEGTKLLIYLLVLVGIVTIIVALSTKPSSEVYEAGRFAKLDMNGNQIKLEQTYNKEGTSTKNIKPKVEISSVDNEKNNLKKLEKRSKNDLSNIDFNKIQKKVPHIYGWLNIPILGISQPIAKSNDNSYYLTHNIFNEKDPAGAVFIDKDLTLNDASVYIYGHYWTPNDMFGPLGKLINNRYSNPVYLYTTDLNNHVKTFKLLGVRSTNSDVEKNLKTYKEINQDFNDWSLSYYNSHESNYKYDGFQDDKQVVILVTCHSDPSQKGRIIAYFQEV